MKTLGIVPARGGSKGVPLKNIGLLCGKPLIQYTAESGLSARKLSRVILSTDDEEIAAAGRTCGLETPFMRPAALAQDDSPMIDVIQHAVSWLEAKGERFDAICLLQPTSPLRRASDIDACIELLESSGADAVVTTLPLPPQYNPHWIYVADEAGFLHLSTGEESPIARRQDLPPAFHRDGSVYVTRRDVLMDENSMYGKKLLGYMVDPETSVNIDSPADWLRAKQLLQKRKP